METVNQAVDRLKLDKRTKWFSFKGNLVRNCKLRWKEEGRLIVNDYPEFVIDPLTDNPLLVSCPDFTYYKK